MTLYRMWLIRLRLFVMPGQFFGAEEWGMLRAAHTLPRNGAPSSSQDHGVGAPAEAATDKKFEARKLMKTKHATKDRVCWDH